MTWHKVCKYIAYQKNITHGDNNENTNNKNRQVNKFSSTYEASDSCVAFKILRLARTNHPAGVRQETGKNKNITSNFLERTNRVFQLQ